MDDNGIHIDERSHRSVPSTKQRLISALTSMILGFALIAIISFWVFPGVGYAGLYTISHPLFQSVRDLLNIYIFTFLIICAIIGWFQGTYFTHRLKNYIDFWKFW